MSRSEQIITLILFNEIIKPKSEKIEVIQPDNFENLDYDYVPYNNLQTTSNSNIAKSVPCSFWDSEERYFYGRSRSNAEGRARYNMRLQEQLYDSSLVLGRDACRPYGNIDSSCAWGNHQCVASFSVCCY